MQKNYIRSVKDIYSYCDENIGENFLFPIFVNLCSESDFSFDKKDLSALTSKIIERLINKRVLKEIPKKFENVYGCYEILKHDQLVYDKRFHKTKFL